MTKVVSRKKSTYVFSPRSKPVEKVKLGEPVLVETEDAFGGQIKSPRDSVVKLDWSKVDGVTGPLYIENTEAGDTLVIEILDIRIAEKGVIVTIPKYGILAEKTFEPCTKMIEITGNYANFGENIRVKINPMIGTIGVAPKSGSIPSGSLGKHGGNMDVRELTGGAKLYLPVFTDGALFAVGDVHAIQADGELCVSAVEVPAEILLRFEVIKKKKLEWPILETRDSYSVLACGDTLDEAAKLASESAVKALMKENHMPFEESYMLASLVVDLKINQIVDPKKGVRAAILKEFITLNSLLT